MFDDAIHFFELRTDLSEKATQNRKKRAVRKWKDILPLILSITGGDLLEAKEIINIGDEFITACLKGENTDNEDNREDNREDNNGDVLNYNSSDLLSEGTLMPEFEHQLDHQLEEQSDLAGEIDKKIVDAIATSFQESKKKRNKKEVAQAIKAIGIFIENGLISNNESERITQEKVRDRIKIGKATSRGASRVLKQLRDEGKTLTDYTHPNQKKRVDFIRDKARECIFKWIHEDLDCPVTLTNRAGDKNRKHVKINGDISEKCDPRVWVGVCTDDAKFKCFLQSQREFFGYS